MKILFFDTETTGLPRNFKAPASDTANWPRLVQLAYIIQNEKGETLYSSSDIIRPNGFVIPNEAAAIHGVTTERAMDEGRPLEIVLSELLAHAKECDLVIGHNIGFDMNIVGAECFRMFGKNPLWGKRTMDTMKESTNYCNLPPRPGQMRPKQPKLQELHQILFGRPFESAHNAQADIEATVKCYWELCSRGIMSKPTVI